MRGRMTMPAPRIFAIVLICVAAALWLGRSYWSPAALESSVAAIEYLPEFTLPDLDDVPRSILEWSGRPLIINFWATWCAPCRREMPLLQALHDSRGDDSLQVIGIALDNRTDARNFVDRIGVTYPILYGADDATAAAESFGDDFIALPFTAVVAPGGEILTLYAGELHADYLDRLVGEMDAIEQGQRSVADARSRLSVD